MLLGVTDIAVPRDTLLASVVIFIVIPLATGVATQRLLTRKPLQALGQCLKPTSIVGLLLTVVLLLGFQAETIVAQPERVLLIAIPLLIQSYGIFSIAYVLARALHG